jgi:hypothetical protein
MSRSEYSDDIDGWALIRWRGAVKSASRGQRGQRFFIDLLAALDSLPVKRLVSDELQHNGEFCALGALGHAKGIKIESLDPHDSDAVSNAFDIADALAREVAYMNDEYSFYQETPENRFIRMRWWVASQITQVEKGDANA